MREIERERDMNHASKHTHSFLLAPQVAENLDVFRVYPRLIGECGGKNFHIIHPSATDIGMNG